MRTQKFVLFMALAQALNSCADDEGTKGTITLSITDSPMDADNVKSVNLFISSVDALKGGEWKSLKSFDQPAGVNLVDYSGGNAFTLIDQYIEPGKFSALRFNLNVADMNSSLIRNPQCNLMFANGSTKPIYYYQSGESQITVTGEINIGAQGHVDYTFDFDVRKSLTLDSLSNYVFKPFIREIETAKAGNIRATVTNYTPGDRVVVFAYPAGQFSVAETAVPAVGEVRFKNAVTSCRIANNKFGLGFLPAGNYDLVFVRHNASGEFLSVEGHYDNVTVVARETVELEVDLTQLTGS